MAWLTSWSGSDTIATIALLVSFAGFIMQYRDRGVPFKVQTYVDQSQAAGKIIDAVELVISARQAAMIRVGWNIFEPHWVQQMSLEQMNADALVAAPVVDALGVFRGALQSNIRFFSSPETLAALAALDAQVRAGTECFTDLASTNHPLSVQQVAMFRNKMVVSCAGANLPASLEALKNAEAVAMHAMEAERKAGASGHK